MSSDSITVTCVGPRKARRQLFELFEKTSIGAEGFDTLRQRPNSDYVVCVIDFDEIHETEFSAGHNMIELSNAIHRKLEYFRFDRAHELGHVVMFPDSPSEKFVEMAASLVEYLRPEQRSWLRFVRTPEDAVAQVIQTALPTKQSLPRIESQLDNIPELRSVTHDLTTEGELDARKIKEAFGLDTMSELARAAGITRQALDSNPSTPGVLPVLEELEKIARLRVHPQLKAPEAFKAWWKRKVPILSDRSPYETWRSGGGRKVVELVDSLLTGDTRG